MVIKSIFVGTVNRFLYGSIKKTHEPKNRFKNTILNCYLEGLGINAISRIFKTSKKSIISMIKSRGEVFESPDTSNEFVVTCDEFYTFVQNKKKNRRWVWVAYSKTSKKVIHFHIGDRSSKSGKAFVNGFSDMEMYFTDDWRGYNDAIPRKSRFIGKRFTQDIERFNLRVRSGPARFIRKTIKFSKTDEMLEKTLNLFFNRYNNSIDEN